ncbi:RDD family protein [Dongia deserti]|uniref:RDD family protein n=1 Tax=Dongia deserti TaxID=2268030 RepID=UPI000E652F9C|nr:RDD family protein [Dongia deserti]
MTERKLPTIVLGRTSAHSDSPGDGAIHDPLVHPDLYEGVALRRTFAFLLDMILLGLVLAIAFIPIAITVITVPVAAFLLAVIYDVLTIGGSASATPGMRVFGLKVITWAGGRPDNLQALLMSAMFWVVYSFTGWLAAIVAFLNPRWRCAHDFLAGTVVVRASAWPGK